MATVKVHGSEIGAPRGDNVLQACAGPGKAIGRQAAERRGRTLEAAE
jgi:hypothetical protein